MALGDAAPVQVAPEYQTLVRLSAPAVLMPTVERIFMGAFTGWNKGRGALDRTIAAGADAVIARDAVCYGDKKGIKEYCGLGWYSWPAFIRDAAMQGDNFYYEQLPKKGSVRSYFDLEVDRDLNPAFTSDRDATLSLRAQEHLVGCFRRVFGEHIQLRIVVLSSSDATKFSEHHIVHVTGADGVEIRWRDNFSVFKAFLTQVVYPTQPPEFRIRMRYASELKDGYLFDPVPTSRNQLFRLPCCRKRKSERVFLFVRPGSQLRFSEEESLDVLHKASLGKAAGDLFWDALVTYVQPQRPYRLVELVADHDGAGAIGRVPALGALGGGAPRELRYSHEGKTGVNGLRRLSWEEWGPCLGALGSWIQTWDSTVDSVRSKETPAPPHPHNQKRLRIDWLFSTRGRYCRLIEGAHDSNQVNVCVDLLRRVAWTKCFSPDCTREYEERYLDNTLPTIPIPDQVTALVPARWYVPLQLQPELRSMAAKAFAYILNKSASYTMSATKPLWTALNDEVLDATAEALQASAVIHQEATCLPALECRPCLAVLGVEGSPVCPIAGATHAQPGTMSIVCGPRRLHLNCSVPECTEHAKMVRQREREAQREDPWGADSGPLYGPLLEPMMAPIRADLARKEQERIDQAMADLAKEQEGTSGSDDNEPLPTDAFVASRRAPLAGKRPLLPAPEDGSPRKRHRPNE